MNFIKHATISLYTASVIILCIFLESIEGRGIQGRIISGTNAKRGQFPWQVVLQNDEIDDLLCGGSILSSLWVLTAGHCTYRKNSIYMIFGTISLENKSINQTSTQLFIHPDYNHKNLNNDVSLILLPIPLTFTETVQPIALVPASQVSNSFLDTVAIVAGYGLTDDEYMDFSQYLQYANLQIIDNSKCLPLYGADVVLSSTMCAKGVKNSIQSTCSGDSGGPLITRDSNGNWMQIGIGSFVAQDMCTEGYPSGYARVTSYRDFILQTMASVAGSEGITINVAYDSNQL